MEAIIIRWGRTPFGRLENESLESLIAAVARELIEQASQMQWPDADLGFVLNMDASSMANDCSILEAIEGCP